MVEIYSSEIYQCPHCLSRRFMVVGNSEVVEGEEWLFFQCPNCHKWMAKREGEEMRRLFDLPFPPLQIIPRRKQED